MSSLKLIGGAALLVVAAVGVGLVQAGYNSGAGESATATSGADAPPWTVPVDQGERAESAGLSMGPMGTAEHYHPQLIVAVDGKPVTVPADIGVDQATGQMSAVHTHTADGVVHVEAPTAGDNFTLGQLFTQWGVELGRTSLGQMEGGQLIVTTNGERYTDDPSALRLAADQKISVSYSSRQPTK